MVGLQYIVLQVQRSHDRYSEDTTLLAGPYQHVQRRSFVLWVVIVSMEFDENAPLGDSVIPLDYGTRSAVVCAQQDISVEEGAKVEPRSHVPLDPTVLQGPQCAQAGVRRGTSVLEALSVPLNRNVEETMCFALRDLLSHKMCLKVSIPLVALLLHALGKQNASPLHPRWGKRLLTFSSALVPHSSVYNALHFAIVCVELPVSGVIGGAFTAAPACYSEIQHTSDWGCPDG